MKNEDLSYKIRHLTETSDESDLDWDPDKFWNLYVARKRRRQRLVVLSYSMAAMVTVAAAYIGFIADHINQHVYTNSSISVVSNGEKTVPTLKTPAPPLESGISPAVTAKTSKPSANHTGFFAGKSSKPAHHGFNSTDHFIETSITVSDTKNDELPSLLQMFEQAQRERELRNLSVQLEDQADYNSFWLTVNQHLLTNRLHSDQLHYERY